MADFLTRQQLKVKLAELDRKTILLFEEHGADHEFFSGFALISDDIVQNVGPNESDWAAEQIDAILEKHDIDPSED